MEDFDKIKNKINTYHSPLDIEDEWKNLSVKRQNIHLKNKLKVRNILIPLLMIVLFISLGYVTYIKNISSQKYQQNTYENSSISTIIDSKDDKGVNNKGRVENTVEEIVLKTNKSNSDVQEKTIIKEDWIEGNIVLGTNYLNEKESRIGVTAQEKQTSKIEAINEEYFINKYVKSSQNKTVSENRQMSQVPENKSNKSTLPSLRKEESEIDLLPIKNILELSTSGFENLKVEPINNNIEAILEEGKPIRKNYLLFEILGQGSFYSINYGRIISTQNKRETDVRIGISLNPMEINGNETGAFPLLIPASINQSFAIKGKHNISLGTGLTFVNDKVVNEPNYFYLLGHLKLQYKYQSNRVFYKVEVLSTHAFENIFTNTNRFNVFESSIWGGVGIGYTF